LYIDFDENVILKTKIPGNVVETSNVHGFKGRVDSGNAFLWTSVIGSKEELGANSFRCMVSVVLLLPSAQ
jgi:hypothetical protein